jgi:hypothetical protein
MLENLNGWELLLLFAIAIAVVFSALYGVFYLVIRAVTRHGQTDRTKRPR